jgi:hypothetical protein
MHYIWSILTSDPDRDRGRRFLLFTVMPFMVWSILMLRIAIRWGIPPWSVLIFAVAMLLVGTADLLPRPWRRGAVVLRFMGTVGVLGFLPLHIATVVFLWHGGQ